MKSFAFSGPGADFAFESAQYSDVAHAMDSKRPLVEYINQLEQVGERPLPPWLFWHPSRVLRAVLNSKPSQLDGPERVDLVEDSTALAMGALVTGQVDLGQLSYIKTRLDKRGLLPKRVEQTFDQTTLEANSPQRSLASAQRLLDKAPGDTLLIPVGHGGIIASLQMAAYYKRLGGQDMQIYPVRFSRTKHQDWQPRLTAYEAAHLKELAEGRTTVVMDEDTRRGVTIGGLMHYLYQTGIVSGQILGMVNHDRRPKYRQNRQGEWWQNYHQPLIAGLKSRVNQVAKHNR